MGAGTIWVWLVGILQCGYGLGVGGGGAILRTLMGRRHKIKLETNNKEILNCVASNS